MDWEIFGHAGLRRVAVRPIAIAVLVPDDRKSKDAAVRRKLPMTGKLMNRLAGLSSLIKQAAPAESRLPVPFNDFFYAANMGLAVDSAEHGSSDQGRYGVGLVEQVDHEAEVPVRIILVVMIHDILALEEDTV